MSTLVAPIRCSRCRKRPAIYRIDARTVYGAYQRWFICPAVACARTTGRAMEMVGCLRSLCMMNHMGFSDLSGRPLREGRGGLYVRETLKLAVRRV